MATKVGMTLLSNLPPSPHIESFPRLIYSMVGINRQSNLFDFDRTHLLSIALSNKALK